MSVDTGGGKFKFQVALFAFAKIVCLVYWTGWIPGYGK